MRGCAECARRRVATGAVVYSAITTVLWQTWSVVGAVRRGYSPAEITVRGLITSALMFSLLYLLWTRIFHYPHEARPRTRYVLNALGWSGLLVVAGLALSVLALALLYL